MAQSCPICGEPVADTQRSCGACGASMLVQYEGAEKPNLVSYPRQFTLRQAGLLIALLCLILAAAGKLGAHHWRLAVMLGILFVSITIAIAALAWLIGGRREGANAAYMMLELLLALGLLVGAPVSLVILFLW